MKKKSVIPVRIMADRQQGLPSLKYLNTEISEVSLFDMPSLDKAFQDIDRLLICNSNFLSRLPIGIYQFNKVCSGSEGRTYYVCQFCFSFRDIFPDGT